MSNMLSELKFTASHEWVRAEGEGIYTIGLSAHAQELLGDMVFVELPQVNDTIDAGAECAVAESVKAASDVYSPLTGTIVAINEELEESPESVNNDPYGDGWLFKIKAQDETELDDLLDQDGYLATIED